jgi:hypothetical protein
LKERKIFAFGNLHIATCKGHQLSTINLLVATSCIGGNVVVGLDCRAIELALMHYHIYSSVYAKAEPIT